MSTSPQSYERADLIIRQHETQFDDLGPQSESLVAEAESILGFALPPTYRRFVLEHGTAIFAGEEAYGVFKSDDEKGSVPNAIWVTFQKRERLALPDNYLVIYAVGNGDFCCLAIHGGEDDDCPVVSLTPKAQIGQFHIQKEAGNFGDWWLSIVEQAVKDTEIVSDDED